MFIKYLQIVVNYRKMLWDALGNGVKFWGIGGRGASSICGTLSIRMSMHTRVSHCLHENIFTNSCTYSVVFNSENKYKGVVFQSFFLNKFYKFGLNITFFFIN